MPVINTRKRKPSEASPLDQLLSVSAQALNSRDGRTVEVESSSGTESASSNSGDFPLRRMRYKNRRRGLKLPVQGRGRRGFESDEDDAHASTRSNPVLKRHRMHESGDADRDTDMTQEHIDQLRALLFSAERSSGQESNWSDWCSVSVAEELRRLQDSIERFGWGGHHGGSLRVEQNSTPLEILQAIHKAVCHVQSKFSSAVDKDELARQIYPTLDFLWMKARQSAEHDMRSKLTFWKYKAQNLKERLRAAVDTTTMPSPHPVLHDALDFVSTFYLLEMAPETSVRGEDPAKELAITKTNEKVTIALEQLVKQRLGERIEQPLASSLLLLSQPTLLGGTIEDQQFSSRSLSVGPGNDVLDMTVVSERESQFAGDAAQTTESRSKRDLRAKSSTSETNETEELSQSATKPLNQAARRRLALLLESQLQSRARSSDPPTTAMVGSSIPVLNVKAPTAMETEIGSTESEPPSRSNHSDAMASPAEITPSIPKSAPSQQPQPCNGENGSPMRQSATTRTIATEEIGATGTRGETWNGSNADSDSGSNSGCTVCGRNDSYSSLLLCDNGCEREFHTFCLQPPLDKIPEGDWYCPKCLAMENIRAGQRVYLCSASLCNKITGAKYCSIHRCKFSGCLNRDNAGGFCRRHEKHREPKISRRIAAPNDSSTAKLGGKESTVLPPSAVTAPPIAPGSSSTQHETAPSRLDTQQLMNNMRQMGIWLPPNMVGRAASTPPSKST